MEAMVRLPNPCPPVNDGPELERDALLAKLRALVLELERHAWPPPVNMAVADLFPTEDLPTLIDATRHEVLTMVRTLGIQR